MLERPTDSEQAPVADSLHASGGPAPRREHGTKVPASGPPSPRAGLRGRREHACRTPAGQPASSPRQTFQSAGGRRSGSTEAPALPGLPLALVRRLDVPRPARNRGPTWRCDRITRARVEFVTDCSNLRSPCAGSVGRWDKRGRQERGRPVCPTPLQTHSPPAPPHRASRRSAAEPGASCWSQRSPLRRSASPPATVTAKATAWMIP